MRAIGSIAVISGSTEMVPGQALQGSLAGAGDADPAGGVGGEAAAVEDAAKVGGAGEGGGQDEVLSPAEGQVHRVATQEGGGFGDPGGEGDGVVVDLEAGPG